MISKERLEAYLEASENHQTSQWVGESNKSEIVALHDVMVQAVENMLPTDNRSGYVVMDAIKDAHEELYPDEYEDSNESSEVEGELTELQFQELESQSRG